MSLRNFFRSFAIILIVSAITRRVQSFTINVPTGPIRDLDAVESSLVQVKQDIKSNQISKTDKADEIKEKSTKAPNNSSEGITEDFSNSKTTDGPEKVHNTTLNPELTSESIKSTTNSDETTLSVSDASDVTTIDQPTITVISEKDTLTTTVSDSSSASPGTKDATDKQIVTLESQPSTETISTVKDLDLEILDATVNKELLTSSTESTVSWKKYTLIDRKKVSTDGTPELITKPSPVTETEKSPKQDKVSGLTKDIDNNKTSQVKENNSSSNSMTPRSPVQVENKKQEVPTKRSESLDLLAASTAVIENVENSTNTKNYSTEKIDIVELQEYEMNGIKKSEKKLQNQLVNDAINEEQLLIEESMNNIDDGLKKFRNTEGDKTQLNVVDQEPVKTKNISVTADKLSVKPITGEKNKSNNLYTVSPNYKPLKKIDVQPPKSFVRDPDDNSWRNETIFSSLGIVFKPKNASKAFTEVLKNKSESLQNNLENDTKIDEPEQLRMRLEKIAELRKSKKKNRIGELYTDYDGNNSDEVANSPRSIEEVLKVDSTTSFTKQDTTTTTDETTTVKSEERVTAGPVSTEKTKKFNIQEYYDLIRHDSDDDDYEVMPKMELKKFKTTKPTISFKSLPVLSRTNDDMSERKATVQHFPPLTTTKYFDEIHHRLPSFRRDDPRTLSTYPDGSMRTESPPYEEYVQTKPYTTSTESSTQEKDADRYYFTRPPAVTRYNEELDRPAYVIKHFGDLFKQTDRPDEDGPLDIVPAFTIAPQVFSNEPRETTTNTKPTDYDYDIQFRKDVIDKFVDNFNQHRDRFKDDFPVLYNSSIVHQKAEDNGKVLASSSAFMKRLYAEANGPGNRDSNYFVRRPCDPDCDKTVELSPAYELHYYVPEEEEKEQIQPKLSTAVYGYNL